MSRGKRGHTENMHVVLDGLAGRFRRRRKKGSNVDVESQIGEGGSNHLLAAVVAVLSDLGHQQARAAAFRTLEGLNGGTDTLDGAGHADLPLVNSGNRLDLGAVAAEDLFQRR